MSQPLTYAKINLDNLVSNYRSVRDFAGTELICVSKADSYGHGASLCVPALYEAGARFFAVANIIEAIALRECLHGADDADIIILGATMPDDAAELVEHNLIQTLYSYDYAKALSEKIPAGKRVRTHIKLDTGMNRLGFPCTDEGVEQIASVYADPHFVCEGLFSHFACSDECEGRGRSITDAQFMRYNSMRTGLEGQGITFRYHHIRNSAAALVHPETALDLARAGIVLYGLTPAEGIRPPVELRPVMDFCTTVTHVHTLRAGESLSYGAVYTAERDMKVATLAVGYADGFIRAYAGTGKCDGATVRIRGVDCPIIGRICMDQCMCAVDMVPNVQPGDEALLFGEGKPVEELARIAGTINYECVCLIGKRIPRIVNNK